MVKIYDSSLGVLMNQNCMDKLFLTRRTQPKEMILRELELLPRFIITDHNINMTYQYDSADSRHKESTRTPTEEGKQKERSKRLYARRECMAVSKINRPIYKTQIVDTKIKYEI